MNGEPTSSFVSRAGLKLEHALREFKFDVTGLVCADFGCNIGGFTDCLLQHGAKLVYAIDTGYGTLAWKLRNDPRVVVMERTNALHTSFPSPSGRGVRGEGRTGKGIGEFVLDENVLAFARRMRREQTDAEQLMWYLLRSRRWIGAKFRRQHPIEPYVVDFYCPESQLAIELDGGQHNDPKNQRKDEVRTLALESKGIRVLRFWDHEVLAQTESVLEAIVHALTPALSQREKEKDGVDLVVIDLAWTPQRLAIPAALKWLAPTGRIITLVKPHYELSETEKLELLHEGVLGHDDALRITQRIIAEMPAWGAQPFAHTQSPLTGGKSSKKPKREGGIAPGNIEFLVLAAVAQASRL